MEECPYKWYLKYVLMLAGPGMDSIFLIGDGWHRFLENWYNSKGKDVNFNLQVCKDELSSEEDAYIDQLERTYQVYAECYNELFHEELDSPMWKIEGVEQVADLTIEFEGAVLRFKGKLDIIGRLFSLKSILDHKTLTGWSSSRGWQFRFQFMFYLWMQHQLQPKDKAAQFVVNACRKPSIRVKQSETLPAYLNRLRNEIMKNSEDYFKREQLKLVQGQMEAFERNVLQPKFRKLAIIANPKTPANTIQSLVFDRHTANCINQITGKECEFLGLCEKNHSPDNYKTRKVKHVELA